MTLVPDASVALKWFLPEEHRAPARALLDVDVPLVAPDLLLVEAANALWRKLAADEVDLEAAGSILAALRSGGLLLRLTPPLIEPALGLAVRLDHPVYDCVYLALAEREGGRVVTADRRFLEAATRGGLGERVVWVEDAG